LLVYLDQTNATNLSLTKSPYTLKSLHLWSRDPQLMNMTITDDLVETFLECPTKCFLRSRGDAGTGNAYAAWVRTKNDVFRIEGTKRLVAEVAPDKCAIGTQATGRLKPVQWHLGIEFTVTEPELAMFLSRS
jgi:hypothetical protein